MELQAGRQCCNLNQSCLAASAMTSTLLLNPLDGAHDKVQARELAGARRQHCHRVEVLLQLHHIHETRNIGRRALAIRRIALRPRGSLVGLQHCEYRMFQLHRGGHWLQHRRPALRRLLLSQRSHRLGQTHPTAAEEGTATQRQLLPVRAIPRWLLLPRHDNLLAVKVLMHQGAPRTTTTRFCASNHPARARKFRNGEGLVRSGLAPVVRVLLFEGDDARVAPLLQRGVQAIMADHQHDINFESLNGMVQYLEAMRAPALVVPSASVHDEA
mmetsp:Transcript_15484/g.29156  ORF Transcript_15484/g.29156 Transcript_15484/m.29156 type:complete len:271 (+) Transcript_15484:279-1091(+)